MNDNVKRDNRRALPRFLLIILCSALCGGVLGFLSEHFSMPVLELLAAARRGLTGWAYLLQLGWVALIGLVSFALCSRAKRVCRQSGPDSDEALEQADLLLCRSLLAVSVGMIGSFISALIAVKAFVRLVGHMTLVPFAVYRLLLAPFIWYFMVH